MVVCRRVILTTFRVISFSVVFWLVVSFFSQCAIGAMTNASLGGRSTTGRFRTISPAVLLHDFSIAV